MPRISTRKLYYLLKKQFTEEGLGIGRDKLFSILREEQLLIIKKKRYTKTTDSKHWMHKYPDLIKGIRLLRPEQLWVADITYLAVESGFVYLHLVTDAYSKRIMGYCVSTSLSATGTMNALEMAISLRKYSHPLIHHSDRGLQYCSTGYVNLLTKNGISISMTQDGSPYDNAVAERVNGILKDEFGLDGVLTDMNEAQKQTRQAVGSYNNNRSHLSCNMLTPQQMHDQCLVKVKTWENKNPGRLSSPGIVYLQLTNFKTGQLFSGLDISLKSGVRSLPWCLFQTFSVFSCF
jgi:putative transposase